MIVFVDAVCVDSCVVRCFRKVGGVWRTWLCKEESVRMCDVGLRRCGAKQA